MSIENETVLVTGGSGFVGLWVILTLLRRGYRVRSTVRSRKREAEIRTALAKHLEVGDRLELVEADLLEDGGWEAAMAGVDFVMHVASPMPLGEFKGKDLVGPARDGTLRVLRAAERAGVKRVVITSSTVAALPD
ncbi:MAG: dihydroflavonol-4-reductase, partial [Devosia sp.]|nr:dihydroflavonol-4-reductase [Devosia sp.]